jgi:hypothetical protein
MSATGSATTTAKTSISPTGYSFSGCVGGVTVLEGGEVEIHHIANTSNGTVTAKKSRFKFRWFGVECSYGYGEGKDLGVLIGGPSPKFVMNVVVGKEEGSFLCASNVVYEAEYGLTTPSSPVYVEPS